MTLWLKLSTNVTFLMIPFPKSILAAPFVKAGAFLAAPFVKVGAKKIALIMKGGVVVGAKLLKGAALKTKVAATKAGLGAALLGKKAVIFGSGAALKGGLATGLATAAGAPLVLVQPLPLLLPPNSSLNSTFLVSTILELQFK